MFASDLDYTKDFADEAAECSRLAAGLALRKAGSSVSRESRRRSVAEFGTTGYCTALNSDHKSEPSNRSVQWHQLV